MNSFFLLSSLSGFVPHIALALSVIGMFLVVKSTFTQEQHIRQQAAMIGQLRDHLGDCLKAQIDSHQQVDALEDRCAKLLARQQRVEKRGPDAQRIELATRMLKRGQGDVQTLLDLGLSNSEIKLLKRLHAMPEQVVDVRTKVSGPVARQGQNLAQTLGSPTSRKATYSGETSTVT